MTCDAVLSVGGKNIWGKELFAEDGWVWISGSSFRKTKVDRWSLGLEHDLGWNVHLEKSTAPLISHFPDSLPNLVFCMFFSTAFLSSPFLWDMFYFFKINYALITWLCDFFFEIQMQAEAPLSYSGRWCYRSMWQNTEG